MTTKANGLLEVYSLNFNDVWFSVACIKEQIAASSFGSTQQTAIGKILDTLPFGLPFQVFHEPSALAKTALATIKDLYEGKEANANLPLALSKLPTYTQRVLKTTMQVPVGYVTTYGAISKAAGGGPRAVGNIMASNPFAPIVPCHRVVKSDFGLGGYGLGGLKVKAELLAREKRGFLEPKTISENGRQLEVYPVEFVLKNFLKAE
jgi:methylated-DNA-[protein]-cysteine S-methyltransferase